MMTGGAVENTVMSNFTLNLFLDSGWYDIDFKNL